MTLPKITQPIFKVKIPSTKKDVAIRPMLVKEEKILLIAKQGQDDNEMMTAVRQVVNNCLVDESVDPTKLTIFDMEYLFLKIRALSIDSKTKVSYKDLDDNKIRDFEINLDDVIVKFPDDPMASVIDLDKGTGLSLRYPSPALYDDPLYRKFTDDEDVIGMENLYVAYSLENYFEKDSVYNLSNEPKDKVIEFISENIRADVYFKIRDYINSMPHLYYKIEYTDDNGKTKEIVLDTLSRFFIF